MRRDNLTEVSPKAESKGRLGMLTVMCFRNPVLGFACALLLTGASGCGLAQGPAPASSATPLPVASSPPSPTLSPPGRQASEADLPKIVLQPSQMVPFQIASRPDLTGPFHASDVADSSESSELTTLGLVSGYRLTAGNPGGSGVYVLQVVTEVFPWSGAAEAALAYYAPRYAQRGYNTMLSCRNPSPCFEQSGNNVVVVSNLANGSTARATAIGWTRSNLLMIVQAGGDSSATPSMVEDLAGRVEANAQSVLS